MNKYKLIRIVCDARDYDKGSILKNLKSARIELENKINEITEKIISITIEEDISRWLESFTGYIALIVIERIINCE